MYAFWTLYTIDQLAIIGNALMHRFPEDGAFERRMQIVELDYIASLAAAQDSIAENYVGLPL